MRVMVNIRTGLRVRLFAYPRARFNWEGREFPTASAIIRYLWPRYRDTVSRCSIKSRYYPWRVFSIRGTSR